MKALCVYCGSKIGAHPDFAEAARSLGTLLAQRRIKLVYGGAKVGLMGLLADAALKNGGEVVGIIPKHLRNKEVVHAGLTELHLVDSLHQRKALMAEISDGFVAMPGGLGTFDEFFEILTWAQLGLHQKPVGLLNVRNYFAPLLELVKSGIEQGFIPAEHQRLLLVDSEASALLDAFAHYQPLDLKRWITRSEET